MQSTKMAIDAIYSLIQVLLLVIFDNVLLLSVSNWSDFLLLKITHNTGYHQVLCQELK